MDDFSKFEQMKSEGVSPEKVYLAAKSDQLDWSTCIRMLRSVFDLSLIEAKEITLRANNLADSLDQYLNELLDAIEQLSENDS